MEGNGRPTAQSRQGFSCVRRRPLELDRLWAHWPRAWSARLDRGHAKPGPEKGEQLAPHPPGAGPSATAPARACGH